MATRTLDQDIPQIPGLTDEQAADQEAQLTAVTPEAPQSSMGPQVGPWEQIPGSKLHEAGKIAYAQLIPKITAPSGTEDWQHQRQEQLEFERAHPWGAPISKHPGTFGTILHGLARAGNIAGDILAPGTMANIPGTDMHRDIEESDLQRGIERSEQLANQKTEAGATETRANAEKENADTAAKGKPDKPEELNQQYADAVGDAVKRGVNPLQDPTVQKFGDAIQNLQKQPQQPQEKLEQQYQDAINAGDHEKAERTLKVMSDLAKAKQAPQRPPQVSLIVPGPNNTQTLQTVRPGQSVPTGAVTPTQFGPEQQKSQQAKQNSDATIKSFTRYQQSFRELAPKLTDKDRSALAVLSNHQDAIAHGLIETNIAGSIDALSGHLETGYTGKLMQGAMTKDQYDKLSPEGKKMMADYFHAIIANFINMKQRMGTAGARNQAMVQAEMNAIPLPYIDPQSAEAMFSDTIQDIQNYSGTASQGQRRVIDLTK